MKTRFYLLLALGALCVCSASASTLVFTAIAAPAGLGAVYNTGSIPGGTQFGGIGINDSLQIVGSYNPTTTTYQGFTYNATTPGPAAFTNPLPTCVAPCTGFLQSLNSGTAQTALHAINNSGTQIGVYFPGGSTLNSLTVGGGTGTTYGTIADPTATINPNISGESGTTSIFFNGIANSGEIVGTYGLASSTHGFIYSGGTGAADTGGTFASDAAPSGFVANSLYFCADAGTNTMGTSDNFEGVNSSGVVAGFCKVSGTTYGFTFTGSAYNLFTFSGATQTELFAVNDSGEIGGNYITGGVNEAFVCTAAEVASAISAGANVNGAYTLSGCTTFDATNAAAMGLTDPLGGSISAVYLSGMNNVGDIVGYFTDTAAGNFDFVAEPAAVTTGPEPGTLVLFGVGGGALWLVRKRRKA
jgi:hypothetical protein